MFLQLFRINLNTIKMLSSFFRAGILLVVTLLTSRLGAAQNAERGL